MIPQTKATILLCWLEFWCVLPMFFLIKENKLFGYKVAALSIVMIVITIIYLEHRRKKQKKGILLVVYNSLPVNFLPK